MVRSARDDCNEEETTHDTIMQTGVCREVSFPTCYRAVVITKLIIENFKAIERLELELARSRS